MVKYFFMLLAVVTMFSCTSNVEEIETETQEVKFTTNFPVEYENMTRASLSDASVKYLYFYVDGELLITQESTTTGFGEINITLTKGLHNISVIASGNAMTNNSFDKVSENTYGYTYNLTVNSSTISQTITLERIVSQLSLYIIDALPKNVESIAFKSTFYNAFDPNTLLATTYTETKGSSLVGKGGVKGFNPVMNFLCPSTEAFSVNLDVIFKFSDGTESTYTFNNIELLMNRRTTIKGSWFTKGANNTFEVDTSWQGDKEYDID